MRRFRPPLRCAPEIWCIYAPISARAPASTENKCIYAPKSDHLAKSLRIQVHLLHQIHIETGRSSESSALMHRFQDFPRLPYGSKCINAPNSGLLPLPYGFKCIYAPNSDRAPVRSRNPAHVRTRSPRSAESSSPPQKKRIPVIPEAASCQPRPGCPSVPRGGSCRRHARCPRRSRARPA